MPDRRATHIVMLVRNPYTHDSRVEKEVRTLIGAGYRVTVVADPAEGLPRREERDGASVLRIPGRGRRIPGLSFLRHEIHLMAVLRRLRPDVLHAHDSNALLPVGLAARRNGVPFVYDAHELWLHRPRRGHKRLYHELSRAYYALVQAWLVPRAAAVVTVSEPIVRHLGRQYRRDDIALVANYPEAQERPPTGPLREMLHSASARDAKLVLHLGGIMATRGLEQLVEAVRDVAGADLVLLGAGDDASIRKAARDAGIAERVHVVPPVPPDDVEAYAAAADVGVVLTQPIGLNNRYSLPNKLFQYMAAAIPVVAPHFPQMRAIVEGSGAGVVCDPSNPTAIAEALRRVLEDERAARAMGERGRQAVLDRLNWSTSAATLLEVYRRITRA